MPKFVIKEPIEFIAEANHYLIDGQKFWRVTRVKSVIKNQGLINWQLSVGKQKSYEIMKKRGDFGSTNHKIFKLILEGNRVNPKNYDEETQSNIRLFQEFLSGHNIKPILIEQHLWSKMYEYAGTTDFVGEVDGKLAILDWKTSKAIYDDFWLQLSAYAWALTELTGTRVDNCGIVLFRDGKLKYETRTYGKMMSEFDVFKACLVIWNWMHGSKK